LPVAAHGRLTSLHPAPRHPGLLPQPWPPAGSILSATVRCQCQLSDRAGRSKALERGQESSQYDHAPVDKAKGPIMGPLAATPADDSTQQRWGSLPSPRSPPRCTIQPVRRWPSFLSRTLWAAAMLLAAAAAMLLILSRSTPMPPQFGFRGFT